MYIPHSFFGQGEPSILVTDAVSRMVVQISGSVGYNQILGVGASYFLSSSFVNTGIRGFEAANRTMTTTIPYSSSVEARRLIISDTTLNAYPSNSMSSSGYSQLFVTPSEEIGSITMVYKLLPDWYNGNPVTAGTVRDVSLSLFEIVSGSIAQAYYPAGIYLTSQSVSATASLGVGVDGTTDSYWRSGSYYVADKDNPLSKFELINSNLISADTSSWYSFPGDKINGMNKYQFLTISPTSLIPVQQKTPGPGVNYDYNLFCSGLTKYPGIDTTLPYNNSNKLVMAAFVVWPKIITDDEVTVLYSYFKNDLEFNI